MELRAFEHEDYETLIQWIDSDKLNYQWGGPNFHYPLDHQQISLHCARPEVFPFLLVCDGKKAGYVELFKVSDAHFRICRVFVADAFRGQGLAKVMLTQLIVLSQTQHQAGVLSLAVFERNTVAKNCYESLGFEVTSHESGTRSFDGEIWDLLLMEKRL
ncbi:GNAT family N-acetyltransferase [Vibrio campbellii]|uniref:GNAT family N-acetyltransferase n=1 Tax=Vibrio campbellii TaxID=680 RepID=A0AAQ3AZJ7_9VIBR|nr:GNAT family N-acetyltransferase [Vibrio campbellii]MCR9906136.1 GNAT family N-acetyltransferase [Vibrio campbellii]WDG09509.1 GNAT family N-acetyltransferase [Vibrio campbellii]